jgi:O-antigen/teichoic acid export membrane protein
MVFLIFGAGLDFWFTRRLFKNNFFYPRYRFILLMAVLVTTMGYILTYYLFATERIRQVKAYNIWRMIFVGLTVVAMIFFRKDAVRTRLLFTFLSEFLLIMVFSSYLIREMVNRFSVRILLKCLGMGIPIMLVTLFGIVVNFSDKFFLEKFGDLRDLSTYYLAFSFAGVLPLISASLQNVWMPEFLKETNLEKNTDRTRKLIYRILLAFFIIGLLIWMVFLLLVQLEIIPSKYEKGTYVLPILLLSQIFMAITTLLNNYLIYFEKTYVIFFSGLFVSTLSIVLSLVLIPWGGIHGAAYTLLISNSIYLLISHFLVRIYKKKFLNKLVAKEALPLRPVA